MTRGRLLAHVAFALVLTAVAALAPAARAAVTGAPSVAPSYRVADFGLSRFCVYLKGGDGLGGGPGGAGLETHDLRLTACQGHAAGTFVGDDDVVERQATIRSPALALSWADANHNGRFDPEDYVYLDTGAADGFEAGTSPSTFAVRLTQTDSGHAGTRVKASDQDAASYRMGTVTFATPSLAWQDNDGDGRLTVGDYAYLLPQRAPGYPANSFVPLASLRVSADNPSGAFGTLVGGPQPTVAESAPPSAGASSSATPSGSGSAPTSPGATSPLGLPSSPAGTGSPAPSAFPSGPGSSDPMDSAGHSTPRGESGPGPASILAVLAVSGFLMLRHTGGRR